MQSVQGVDQNCYFKGVDFKINELNHETSSVIYYACVISKVDLINENDSVYTNTSTNIKANDDVKMVQYDESNILQFIPHSIFDDFPNMEIFEILPGTGLSSLKPYYLKNAQQLHYFIVTKNQITSLQAFQFVEALNLREIDLSGNKITSVHRSAFNDLPNLQKVYLQDNQIQILDPNTFSRMLSLNVVDLSKNNSNYNPATEYSFLYVYNIRLG